MIAVRMGKKITPMNSVEKANISSNQITSVDPPILVATTGFHSRRTRKEHFVGFEKLDIIISLHIETKQARYLNFTYCLPTLFQLEAINSLTLVIYVKTNNGLRVKQDQL